MASERKETADPEKGLPGAGGFACLCVFFCNGGSFIYFFNLYVALHDLWDLSSLTKD